MGTEGINSHLAAFLQARQNLGHLQPYRFAHEATLEGFTSDFKGRISRPLTWGTFCTTSCSTSVVMLLSYGTNLSSIGENRSETSSIATQDSMWNGSPDMPLSSIRWNLYGPRQSVDWPIASQKEQRNLSKCCAVQPDASNILNVSSGLASGLLNCLGKDNIFSINYA